MLRVTAHDLLLIQRCRLEHTWVISLTSPKPTTDSEFEDLASARTTRLFLIDTRALEIPNYIIALLFIADLLHE